VVTAHLAIEPVNRGFNWAVFAVVVPLPPPKKKSFIQGSKPLFFSSPNFGAHGAELAVSTTITC